MSTERCSRDTSSPRCCSSEVAGGGVQAHRRDLQLLVQPLGACFAGRAGRGVDLPSLRLDRLGEGRGQRFADDGQHEHVRGEGLAEAHGELARLRGVEMLRVAQHDDAAVGQERGREQGVDHRPDGEVLVAARCPVLLDGDGERPLAAGGTCVSSEFSPGALWEEVSWASSRSTPRSTRAGSPPLTTKTAASPATASRCSPLAAALAGHSVAGPTRGSRQAGRAPCRCPRRRGHARAGSPRRSRAAPRPRDASRRSSMPSPSRTPRKVLFDEDSNSG